MCTQASLGVCVRVCGAESDERECGGVCVSASVGVYACVCEGEAESHCECVSKSFDVSESKSLGVWACVGVRGS